jgi:hypothetical protein
MLIGPNFSYKYCVLNYPSGQDILFNNPIPGNARAFGPKLMMALTFDDHYFYGRIRYLYLIGTVVQNFERILKLCFYICDYCFRSNWKHPIYSQSHEIFPKPIRLLFEVSVCLYSGCSALWRECVELAART